MIHALFGKRSAIATALLVTLVLLIWLLLYTPLGLSWTLALLASRVPGLDVESPQGRLVEGLDAARLRWRDASTEVDIASLRLRWDLRCLWRLSACIDSVQADTVVVTLADDDTPAPRGRIALPRVPAPLAVTLDELRVERLELRSATSLELHSIEAGLAWRGTRLNVDRLVLAYQEHRARLGGRIDLEDAYPLDLSATLEAATGDRLALSADGTLAALELEAALSGRYAARAEARLDALAPELPFAIEARVAEPIAVATGAERALRLGDLALRASGQLEAFSAELGAQLDSPWLAPGRLRLELNRDASQLHIPTGRLETEAGALDFSGALDLAGTQGWGLLLRPVGLALRQPELPRPLRLDGGLELAGAGLDAALTARAVLDLAGRYGDHAFEAAGELRRSADGALDADGLRLVIGDNRLGVDGHYGDDTRLDTDLALTALNQILPELGGRIVGQLRLAGSLQAPQVDGEVSGDGLAFGDYRLSGLHLNAGDDRLRAAIQGLVIDARRVDRAELQLAGRAAEHWLELEADVAGFGTVRLDCSGTLQATTDWRGRCEDLSLALTALQGEGWALAEPVALDYAEGRVRLDPLCLRRKQGKGEGEGEGEGELCNTAELRTQAGGVDGLALRFRGLELGRLADLGLMQTRLRGQIAGALDGAWHTGGLPRLDGHVESQRIEVLAGETADDRYPLLTDLWAAASVDDAGIRSGFGLGVGADGRAVGELVIRDLEGPRNLDGRLLLAGIDLSEFAAFDPQIEALGGRLDGEVAIGGRLPAPSFDGELELRDGLLRHELLPDPVESLNLTLQLAGPSARFSGTLVTGAGRGSLDGRVDWADPAAWRAELQTDLQGLLLRPFADSELVFSPQLDLSLRPGMVEIEGGVQVPSADVVLEELPRGAVSISRDAVVVGREQQDDGWRWRAELDIRLGEDVRLRGYGAEIRLGGDLSVRGDADNPLTGQGEIFITEGRYRAYGQRLLVRDGSLLFRGPLDNPDIRLEAVREQAEDNVTVGIRARGPVRNPRTEIFSVPAMPQQDAMHYLLTGRGPGGAGVDTRQAVNDALIGLGAAQATRGLGEAASELGIEDFRVTTGSGAGGTEVQLSGYLTPDLFVRYGMGIHEQVNTLRLRYRLRDRLYVEVISGLESAVDLIYSFSR